MRLQFHTFLFETWQFRLIRASPNFRYPPKITCGKGSLEFKAQTQKENSCNLLCSTMTVAASQEHQKPSWIENSTWLYCVKCRTYPGSEAGRGRRPYFVTDCGHIYCSQCRVIGQYLPSSNHNIHNILCLPQLNLLSVSCAKERD